MVLGLGAHSLAIWRGPRIASQSGMLSDPHGTNPLTKTINFNVPVLADGVTRLVNPLLPVPSNAHGRGR